MSKHTVSQKARAGIWPPKEQESTTRKPPTLAERIREEGPPPITAKPRPKLDPSKPRPRFVREEGHVLEPVGYMGKLSPVTPAKKPDFDFVPPPEGERMTLADRVRADGLSA